MKLLRTVEGLRMELSRFREQASLIVDPPPSEMLMIDSVCIVYHKESDPCESLPSFPISLDPISTRSVNLTDA